jgi:hypothetical protein
MPRKPLTDDCFAKLDAAFETLAAELALRPGELARPEPPAPERPQGAKALRIVQGGETAAGRRAAVGYGQPLDEYAEAFDLLDAQLAGHATDGRPDDTRDHLVVAAAPAADPVPATMAAPDVLSAASPAPAESDDVSAVPAPSPPSSGALSLWRSDGHATLFERLVRSLQNLSAVEEWLDGCDGSPPVGDVQQIAALLDDLRDVCDGFDLETARVRVDFAMAAVGGAPAGVLRHEIAELARHMRHDLRSCTIVAIPRTRLWAFKSTLDGATAAVFPTADAELSEGARCFGFGRYSAATFHMLRAAQPAMQALAIAADRRMSARASADRPGGRELLMLLESRLAAAQDRPTSRVSEDAVGFLERVVMNLRRLHEAERQLARGAVDQQQAVLVYHATRDLLTIVAAQMSEADARAMSRASE